MLTSILAWYLGRDGQHWLILVPAGLCWILLRWLASFPAFFALLSPSTYKAASIGLAITAAVAVFANFLGRRLNR